jgi:hypothetical protein
MQDSEFSCHVIVPYHVTPGADAFVCCCWVKWHPEEMVCPIAVFLEPNGAELLLTDNMFLVVISVKIGFKALRVWHTGQKASTCGTGLLKYISTQIRTLPGVVRG